MRFVDLFSGCGGASCGLRAAGWTPVCAAECNAHALQTYARNFPEARAVGGDLRDPAVQQQVLEASAGVDVVVGGPPCQGFSSCNTSRSFDAAGKVDGKFGAMNELPLLFAELAVRIGPSCVLMEEVPRARVVLPAVTRVLEDAGFVVEHRVLTASWYGVPQRRQRLFLVATRAGARFSWPEAEDAELTAGEALARAPVPTPGPVVTDFVRREILARGERGGRSGQYGVIDTSLPARTVLGNTLNAAGPYTLKRGDVYHTLSIEEVARLQGFPPTFEFVGPSTYVRKQLGNAVPPELARRLGLGVSRP